MRQSAGLIVAAVLAFIAFLIWNRTRTTLERQRMQLNAQTRMLDRVGSGPALAEFLKTDEGQRFLKQIAPPEPQGKDARGRIFMLTTLGLVALFGGFLLVNGALLPTLLAEEPELPIELVRPRRPAGVLVDGGRCRCAGRRVDHASIVEKMGHAGCPSAAVTTEVTPRTVLPLAGPLRGSSDIPCLLQRHGARAEGLPAVAVQECGVGRRLVAGEPICACCGDRYRSSVPRS